MVSMVLFQSKPYFSKILGGSRLWTNIFRGGGGEGIQLLISIQTYRTCDFPGRGYGPPPPPPPSGFALANTESK